MVVNEYIYSLTTWCLLLQLYDFMETPFSCRFAEPRPRFSLFNYKKARYPVFDPDLSSVLDQIKLRIPPLLWEASSLGGATAKISLDFSSSGGN